MENRVREKMKQNRHRSFYCFLKTIFMIFPVLWAIVFKFFGDHSDLHSSVQLTESWKFGGMITVCFSTSKCPESPIVTRPEKGGFKAQTTNRVHIRTVPLLGRTANPCPEPLVHIRPERGLRGSLAALQTGVSQFTQSSSGHSKRSADYN